MDRRCFNRLALGGVVLASQPRYGFAEGSRPESWPGWRGPERTAYASGRAWPVKLDSDHLQLQWDTPLDRSYSGPVVVGNHVFATGAERWRSRPYGKYWSMITNGQQILALDEQGKLLLINAKPEAFDLIDERVVSQNECWAHLAMVDQQIFIRHLSGMSVFRWS